MTIMEDYKETNSCASQKNKKTGHVHRIGTVTFGLSLIVFGCLFLARLIWPGLDYRMVFRMWPCVLICLGIEVLAAALDKEAVFVYDKAAVVLMVIMLIFAMSMAGADYIMEHAVPLAGKLASNDILISQ